MRKKEDGYDSYRKELNRMMNQNLDSGENNFSAVKLISFGRKDSNPKQAYRSLSQIENISRVVSQKLMLDLNPWLEKNG